MSLASALKYLSANSSNHAVPMAYYDGRQELKYSKAKLKEIFGGHEAAGWWQENWSAVVVNAVADKIKLQGFGLAKGQNEQALADIVDSNELLLNAPTVHLDALIAGESFLVLWKNKDDKVEIYPHDPRMTCVVYDPDRPRVKLFAAKWFDKPYGTNERRRHVTIWYPDRVEHYVSKGDPSRKGVKLDADEFLADTSAESGTHDFGEVPVFHFRRELRAIRSELHDVYSIQDAINKTKADMMVAEEFLAVPMRWAVSEQKPEKQPSRPDMMLWFPAGDTESQATATGQYAQVSMENFIRVMEGSIEALAAIKQMPKYYFKGATGEVSGDALVAMEAPLNDNARSIINLFRQTWKKVIQFALRLNGVTVAISDISVYFDDPATIQPKAQAETAEIYTRTGVPLRLALERQGWESADLDKLDELLTSPELDEASKIEIIDKAAEKTARNMEPVFEAVLTQISDMTMAKLTSSGLLDAAIKNRVAAKALDAENKALGGPND